MSYQVLARKWRPQSFSDLVGQESTVRILSNALDQHRIHHAYLFTGTRGVGKTTLARIIAKCLNCVQGISSHPCGTCAQCEAIQQGQSMDVLEVDAASRTKVEDTRSLLENIHYPPAQGRFKIYLIDEVHMLSNHSFNALLKTLEEPPEHVKFLFATTEPKRIPVTILSRCLQFHLKSIPESLIVSRLETICQAEHIQHDSESLPLLAQEANGSLRDALSLLDQAALFEPTLQADHLANMLGIASSHTILPIFEAISEQNTVQLQRAIHDLSKTGIEADSLLKEMLTTLHRLSIQKIDSNAFVHLQSLAEHFTDEELQLFYQIAIMGRRDLTYAPTPWMGFEMTLFRMLAFKPFELPKEETIHSTSPQASVPVVEKKSADRLPLDAKHWAQLIDALNLSGMTHALASHSAFHTLNESMLTLLLNKTHEPLFSQKTLARLEEALSEYYQKPIKVQININASLPANTPTELKKHQENEARSTLKNHFAQHSNVQSLIKTFDAELDVSLK